MIDAPNFFNVLFKFGTTLILSDHTSNNFFLTVNTKYRSMTFETRNCMSQRRNLVFLCILSILWLTREEYLQYSISYWICLRTFQAACSAIWFFDLWKFQMTALNETCAMAEILPPKFNIFLRMSQKYFASSAPIVYTIRYSGCK